METIIAGLLMSLFSGLANYSISKRDRDINYQRQIELLDKQNAYNTEMFNKTNEYNDPANQLNRLMGAGASGGGALSMLGNQTANSIGSSTVPGVAGLNPGLANIFGDYGQKAAELENLKADTRVKNADANRNETTLYYDIEKTKAETNKLAEELNLTSEQRKNFEIINKYADQKSQEEIRLIQENYKLVEQQVKNAKEEEKKQIWENFYRDNFGIDVHDDVMNQIVSSSLKGEMPSVFAAFEKTANFVFSKLEEYGNIISNKFNKGFDYIGDKIDNIKLPTLSDIFSNKNNIKLHLAGYSYDDEKYGKVFKPYRNYKINKYGRIIFR